MPSNSARVIEMEVTSRLEAMLARIKGIKEISSTSGNGWGRITLELDKHTNIDAARFEASTIVRQTWPDLPEELSYPILAYIIHSGFISGYQNRYGDNLKPPTNVYHRMTA